MEFAGARKEYILTKPYEVWKINPVATEEKP